MTSKIHDETVGVFQDLRIVDNFYQTSAYYPMPVVAITSLNEDGSLNMGPYSLVFPYYVVGKGYYAMLLQTRNQSNTAKNILRSRKCALNFLPDKHKFMKECVRMGFPGDDSGEKMKDCLFTFQDGLRARHYPDEKFPRVIAEAYQVFECTWMAEIEGADRFAVRDEYEGPFNDFNGITSGGGAHFILRVDRILMRPELRQSIINGVRSRSFPAIPVDYGFRDNNNFWFSKFKRPYKEPIPAGKGSDVNYIRFNANRIDPYIKFTDEACEELVKVPKVFLRRVLNGCVDWARENEVDLLQPEHMDRIRNKRSGDK